MAYHLILADDDPSITEGLRHVIENAYPDVFAFDIASNGDQLMRLLCDVPVSLIITDIKMPGTDGLQCLTMIREQQLPCEVVLLSGYDDYSLIRRALKLDAFDYLLKPVHINTLLKILSDLLPRLEQIVPRKAKPSARCEAKALAPYFDTEPPAKPLSEAELEAQLHAFVCALQALDGEAMRQAIDAFFEGLSPDIWDEQRLKAELIRCVSELMERIPAMIRIIGDLRLTEFDAASSIRNLPTFSQLHKRMLDIAEQYLDKLRQNAKNHDQLLIRRAKEFIDQHYMENIALDQLAATLHMNATYFSAVFKQWTNTTFREYLRSVRIRQGIRLIETEDLKLYEIAERVGYQNASHFNRAFKTVTGVTPSVWAMHHTK